MPAVGPTLKDLHKPSPVPVSKPFLFIPNFRLFIDFSFASFFYILYFCLYFCLFLLFNRNPNSRCIAHELNYVNRPPGPITTASIRGILIFPPWTISLVGVISNLASLRK